MIRVALDLRRTSLVAFDEQSHARPRERHPRGEKQRLAGDDLLGLPHIRHDRFVGLSRAGTDAGERERRAHQLQEAATPDRIEPFRRVLRKLPMEELLELRCLGYRFKAPPVIAPASALEFGTKCLDVVGYGHVRVYRWQVEQLVLPRMLYSLTSWGPRTDCGTVGR